MKNVRVSQCSYFLYRLKYIQISEFRRKIDRFPYPVLLGIPLYVVNFFYIRTNYWKTTRLKLIRNPEQFEKLLSLKIICKSTQNLFNRYIFANMPCVPIIKSHLWCGLLKRLMSNYMRWDVSFASQYWFNRLISGNITQHVLKIYDKLSKI